MRDAKEQADYDVPEHLRNAPTKLMKEMGLGAEYRYAHDEPNAYAAGENYFPPEWPIRATINRRRAAGRENRRKVGMAG